MSEPNVLVNFRLDKDQPLRFKWLATDGVPGRWLQGPGHRDQARRAAARLAMDASAILEQTAPDPGGGLGAYPLTFNGMVGFAADHPDRKVVDSSPTGDRLRPRVRPRRQRARRGRERGLQDRRAAARAASTSCRGEARCETTRRVAPRPLSRPRARWRLVLPPEAPARARSVWRGVRVATARAPASSAHRSAAPARDASPGVRARGFCTCRSARA